MLRSRKKAIVPGGDVLIRLRSLRRDEQRRALRFYNCGEMLGQIGPDGQVYIPVDELLQWEVIGAAEEAIGLKRYAQLLREEGAPR